MKLMAHLFEGRYNIDGYNVCTKHMIGAHGECVSAEWYSLSTEWYKADILKLKQDL